MLMTLVLLMVFAFGANGLNTDPIWTDELYALSNMGAFDGPFSPAEVVRSVSDNFPDHVPLFFLMGAGWAHFVGWTQFALRLLPVLAGVLMIAWMYRLGSDMFNRFTGLLAAILLGTSAYMILYMHDFRMYSLFLMLATMHFWFYWRLAHGYGTTRLTFTLFVLSAIALFYTHMFSFILFAGLGVYHLVFVSKSRHWLQLAAGWGLAALLFLPYLPVVIAGLQWASEKQNVTSRAASAPELMITFLNLFANGSWLVALVMGSIFIFVLLRRRPIVLVKFMLLPLTMMVLILLVNELVGIIPLTRMRYFLIVWIPLTMAVAAGLSMVPRRPLVTAALLLIWMVAGFQYYRSLEIMSHVGSMVYTRLYPPLQDYVFFLAGKVRSEDYLLGFTDSNHVNKDLTLGKSAADYYTQLQLGIDGGFIRRGAYGDWLAGNIREKIDGQPYLLFTYNPQDLAKNHDKVLEAIQRNYIACDVLVDEATLFVQRHVRSMLDCNRTYRRIEYDNGVTLVDRFARYLPEQHKVQILTGWEVENERVLGEYNISLQIITPDWHSVGRDPDRHLYNNVLKWYEAEISTADLPPGEYRVMVIVYDRQTVKKVYGIDMPSGRSDDNFPIIEFTVEAS